MVQNRFIGDIADYAKHGLLRRLTGMVDGDDLGPLRLGLVWYLIPDGCEDGAGGRIGFLVRTLRNEQTYRVCDPDLWEALHRLVRHDRHGRCVHRAERAGLLPPDTQYYGAMLHFPAYLTQPMRAEIRRRWLAAALRATRDADLVMLDADNGMAPDNKMFRKDGPKFAYISDLQEFWNRGQSIVLYQHLGMARGGAEAMIRGVADRIRNELVPGGHVHVISLRMGASVFHIVVQPRHRERIEARIDRMLGGPWGNLFGRVP